MDEIVNRVAKSPLITLDFEEFYPEGKRQELDISQWLFEGLILREKEFRAALKDHNWDQYKDTYVAINCSSDAIFPSWAILLVTSYLEPVAKLVSTGTLKDLLSCMICSCKRGIVSMVSCYTQKIVFIQN